MGVWNEDDNDLLGEFDAQKWGQRFVDRVSENPSIATDVGTMTTWFAGALVTGWDEARGSAP